MDTTSSNTLSKSTIGFGLSLALVSVINGIVVIAKESSPAVMAGMKRVLGHHWTTHSAAMLLLFVVLGAILSRLNFTPTVGRFLALLLSGIFLGAALIVGFYLIGD
jgi:hypothetical protein